MKALFFRILSYLAVGIIRALPAGMTADSSAMFGLIALMANINAYAQREIVVITTTTANASVLTAAQSFRSPIRLDSGANGAFTLTLAATAAIIAALGPTIPTDGTFSKKIVIVNNSVGQTGTLTAGDASTTITGTATIATATVREFLMTVTSATTLTYENLGSKTL